MQRFRRILVYPGSMHTGDPAISSATDLALRTGAELTIVWIIDPEGSCSEKRRRKREARLDELTSRLRDGGVQARGIVLVGKKPAALLVEQTQVRQIDLVVKTARPGDDPEARTFSSIAKDLLRTSPCPVWIVRGPGDDTERVILAAVTPLHLRSELERMDRDVIEVAVQLADIRDAELHIVSAWEAIGAGLLRSRLSYNEYQAHLRSSELDARDALHKFLKPYGISSRKIHFRAGRAAIAIATAADELSAELIVVGSAGRTGIRRWILGNTVEQVLDESITAVLGVRQSGDGAGVAA